MGNGLKWQAEGKENGEATGKQEEQDANAIATLDQSKTQKFSMATTERSGRSAPGSDDEDDIMRSELDEVESDKCLCEKEIARACEELAYATIELERITARMHELHLDQQAKDLDEEMKKERRKHTRRGGQ